MGYAECKHGKYCGHDCCVPSLCNEFEPVQETEVITLADLIRAMSDEELAKWYASSVVVSSAMMLSHFGVVLSEEEMREGANELEKIFIEKLKKPVED